MGLIYAAFTSAFQMSLPAYPRANFTFTCLSIPSTRGSTELRVWKGQTKAFVFGVQVQVLSEN